MMLFNDIVDLLSDKAGSLTDAMLKTKVLMHKIGHKEVAAWLNDELDGYSKEKTVPEYRVIPVRLVGNLRNIAYVYSNQTLPTAHLSEKLQKEFSRDELRQSIHVLEELASRSDGHLIHPVAPELYAKLGEALDGFWVDNAWTQMEPTQIMNGLAQVRSRLLDFVLSLQEKLGDVPEDQMKEAAKGVDAEGMFASAVFGDNTTVIVGQHNVATVVNKVTKGDFNSLADTLKKAGVDDADVDELKTAIQHDDVATVAKDSQFGPKVRAWMAKMTGKAIDGTWSIGLSAGGKLLADALGAHYGIK
ncbi:hypothetical protein CFB50_13815 [Burkholderia sp. AU33423]|uniref:AbiTii domain-containing protein n=1 Tax=Burkholderia sp. AU33423 TaxID=2015355 RepID=UPI000B7ABDAF|nr:hypothetical protein [Burkholderia sp. AU33423]OXI85719.1 hypothetical protein CFB50_13815 [Burkholderia sp. AU33423]